MVLNPAVSVRFSVEDEEIGFASSISLTGLRVGDGGVRLTTIGGKDSVVIGSVSPIVSHSLLTMSGSGGVLPTDLVSISFIWFLTYETH